MIVTVSLAFNSSSDFCMAQVFYMGIVLYVQNLQVRDQVAVGVPTTRRDLACVNRQNVEPDPRTHSRVPLPQNSMRVKL